MATIVKFSPLAPPERTRVLRAGRSFLHECEDASGRPHRQRLPLGSVRGIFYLDAICLHCGAHFIWIDDGESLGDEGSAGRASGGGGADPVR